ncbi:cytochrome b [Telluria mixta]|uniref:Cytochrome b n=1 Tax=Telluria mixta TaxID=34071 RepID=A0ABT2C1A7_9BURK|nr:cytochrome b [Telluria mixta]MCS0631163.1 cytochrome b [Telluria mixta]WEM95701.1 cytochrome b [Telluria mixta]
MKAGVEGLPLSPQPKYGAGAMLFHWLLAAMIVLALVLGWYMAGLPFSPARVRLFNWHKWLGMTVLLVAALRLAWRLGHPAPPLPPSMAGWERGLAHLSHGLMYLLFFAVPLIGWARSSAAGFQIVYLGLVPLPDLVGKDKALAALLAQAHMVGAWLLAALVVLHVAAAVKHAVIDRDGVFSRMLPSLFTNRNP